MSGHTPQEHARRARRAPGQHLKAEEARRLRREGAGHLEIAAALQVPAADVPALIETPRNFAWAEIPHRPMAKPVNTRDRRNATLWHFQKGVSPKAIAHLLGVSEPDVLEIISTRPKPCFS